MAPPRLVELAGAPSFTPSTGETKIAALKANLSKSWELLAPHARPRIPALVTVGILGAISAAGQSVVLLLFEPIWSLVLFPTTGEASEGSKVRMVTDAFSSAGEWAVRQGLVDDQRVAVLLALVVFALSMAILSAVAQYGCTLIARWVGYRMIVDLRVRLARHLMGLSVRYHGERRFGDLLSRVSSDVTTTLGAINIGLKSLFQEPLFALGTLAVAYYAAPLPTLGIVLLLPIAAWPVSKLSARVRKGSRRSLTTLGSSVQALSQMFQGIRTVKAFGGEEREVARYREINDSYLRTSMKMVRAIALTHAWTAFYSIAGIALLVGVLGVLTIRFDIFGDGGYLMVFFLAIARLNNHVKIFTKALTAVQESVGAASRISDLLDEPVEVQEADAPAPVDGIRAGIRFENVGFTYPDSAEAAIHGLTLDVRPGETLALVGPSGAGKSTLIDLVARFIDPSSGRITVDGADLRQLSRAGWTAQYALVGQVPFLFHASIGENVRYGRPEATQEEVEAAAGAADIHDFVSSLPAGYDTDVADMGSRLSGGQRQRITIARALLKGAPLLLLDEATSSLDSGSEAEVQGALERLMADRTVIVIAHRLSTVRNADRIAVLEGGRLVEIGPHEELMARGGAYARLVSLQRLAAPQEAGVAGSAALE